MEDVNEIENKTLQTLLQPFFIVKNYFNEVLASKEKPLGEKLQTKVREKLHPILSPLSSWVADNVLKHFESKEKADTKAIVEQNEKGTTHFLEQAKTYVGSLYQNLKGHIKKTNPEKVPRVKPTVLCGINSILDRGVEATKKLFNTQNKSKSAKAEARVI